MDRSKATLLFVVVTILTCLLPNGATGQSQTVSLLPGVPIERTLARGQRLSFSISVEQDHYLHLVVEQRGIDVVVRVFSPAGKMLGEFDSPNGTEGPESVSLISATTGVYRIEVAPLGEGEDVATGRFEIRILELRRATSQELQADKNQESLKIRGLSLLADIAATLDQIRLPQTRVRSQLQAAQLLWDSDEKLAGKLVAAAIEGVKEYLAQVSSDEDYYQTYAQAMQLRQEVFAVLGSRDPEMALSFLRSTNTLISPGPGQNLNQRNQELQFEVSLASQILARDPKRAFQIAEDTLKRGYSHNLIEIINRLRTADPESAAKLARQVTGKLQGEKLLNNHEATNLAINLLRIAHSPTQRGRNSPIKTEVALLSEHEYRDLFEKTLAEALSYPVPPANAYTPERDMAQNILNSLKSMSAQMAGPSAGSLAAIEKKIVELNAAMNPQNTQWQKYYDAINSGSLDAGLESIAQAPHDMRDQLYQHIAQKSAGVGDFERAKQILKDHITNPSQLYQALSNLEQQNIQVQASKGRIEEALRIVSTLRTSKERAAVISQIVNQIGPGQKKATTLNLLEQARTMIGSSARVENQEELGALLQIARAFSRYDSKRGFEVMEPILDQFNEMSAAAQVLNGFGQQYYQNGELLTQNGNSVANAATQLITTLGSLALANFDRAKAGADRVERPEVRIGAYLAIAQQAISPTERRTPSRW